jgi:hypothetical protein
MARKPALLTDIVEVVDARAAGIVGADVDRILARIALIRIDAAVANGLELLAWIGASQRKHGQRR